MSSTATFKPATRRGQQSRGLGSAIKPKQQPASSNHNNQAGSSTSSNLAQGGSSNNQFKPMQSPNIKKSEFYLQRENHILAPMAQSRPSIVLQQQNLSQHQKIFSNEQSNQDLISLSNLIVPDSQLLHQGKDLLSNKQKHTQKVLSLMAPVTPSNNMNSTNIVAPINLNDYYSVQSQSYAAINPATASRNIIGAGSQTALKKSSVKGGASNRKSSNVSASRNTYNAVAVVTTNYSLIKQGLPQPSTMRQGISGRMQKQFRQYHGEGGGSPPLKGTQRTSMMTIGGTGSNKEIMTLIPIKSNERKGPQEKRNQQASVSQERSRQKVSTAINTRKIIQHQLRITGPLEQTSRQHVIHNLTSNGVRTSSVGGIQQNSQYPISKQEIQFYEGNHKQDQMSENSSQEDDSGAMENSNFIKEYQGKTTRAQFIPVSSPKNQYSPKNFPRGGAAIAPAFTPSNNNREGMANSSSFFKSPANVQKKSQFQPAKTTNNGGSPIPPMSRHFGGNTQVKTVMTSRLSVGASVDQNVQINKKNLSLNSQNQDNQTKNRWNNVFGKQNHLNLNTNYIQGQPAASLLQIDLSQLSVKNGSIHHLQQPSNGVVQLQADDDQSPFEMYGSQVPSVVSEQQLQQHDLAQSPHIKKRDSLLQGPQLQHKNSVTQLTSTPQPPPQVSSFQHQLPSAVLFGKSPKASQQGRPSHLQSFNTTTNRHSIVTKQQQPQHIKPLTKKKTQIINQGEQQSSAHISNQQASKSKTQRMNSTSNYQAKSAQKLKPNKNISESNTKPTLNANLTLIDEQKDIQIGIPQERQGTREEGLRQINVDFSEEKSLKSKDESIEVKLTFPMVKTQFIDQYKPQKGQLEDINRVLMLDSDIIYFIGPNQMKVIEEKAEADDKYDDEEGYYLIKEGEQLMYRYEIIKILGKGSFAQVVCCKDHKFSTPDQDILVAIKITRNTELDHKFAQSEANLLKYIMEKDPLDQHNIVRLIDEFQFRDHHCFVFELLESGDMFEHLKATGFSGFQVNTIKQYAKEILKALVFLEKHEIIHCDLKPENILLIKDTQTKQSKLKIVDFGSGSFRGEQAYTYVQSRFYRAPEVIMRLMPPPTSYSEKVDIWSLGCILAELFTGEPLFPGNNEQEQLELIMEICGIPSPSFIEKTRKKEHYFDTDYSPFLIEDEEQGILRIPDSKKLEQIILTDDLSFIDFIRECLVLDPDQRFSASQAINHSWINQQRSPSILKIHKRTSSEFSSKPEMSELEGLQRPMASSISSTHQAFLAATSSMKKREEDSDRLLDVSPLGHQNQYNSNYSKLAVPFNPENQAQLFTLVDLREDDNSQTSSPKNEGGIQSNKYSSLSRAQSPYLASKEPYEEVKIGDMDITAADMLQKELQINSQSAQKSPSIKLGGLNTSSIEKRRDREARKAAAQAANNLIKTPLKGSLVVTQSPMPKSYETQMQGQTIQVIGHYEIFRDDEGHQNTSLSRSGLSPLIINSHAGNQQQKHPILPANPIVRESVQSVTSGIASEANIPPLQHQSTNNEGILSQEFMMQNSTTSNSALRLGQKKQDKGNGTAARKHSNQTDVYSTQSNAPPVTTENSINKITITFYQKRNQQQNVNRNGNNNVANKIMFGHK